MAPGAGGGSKMEPLVKLNFTKSAMVDVGFSVVVVFVADFKVELILRKRSSIIETELQVPSTVCLVSDMEVMKRLHIWE